MTNFRKTLYNSKTVKKIYKIFIIILLVVLRNNYILKCQSICMNSVAIMSPSAFYLGYLKARCLHTPFPSYTLRPFVRSYTVLYVCTSLYLTLQVSFLIHLSHYNTCIKHLLIAPSHELIRHSPCIEFSCIMYFMYQGFKLHVCIVMYLKILMYCHVIFNTD